MSGSVDRDPMSGYRLIFTYLILVLIGLVCAFKACAQTQQQKVIHQYDTIVCKTNCISKFITSTNGKTERVYAVYTDDELEISDIIPVSKSVFEYITLCNQNNVKPSLGIKLKDGKIMSLIRTKRTYYGKDKKRRHSSISKN